MDLLAWAFDAVWPLVVLGLVLVYLFVMVRMEDRAPQGVPEKPAELAGYDVEYCPNCSVWVPAKAPWCGIKGCARPHRSG